MKKEVGVTQTVFVYNIAGQLVAEYDTEGASGTGTSYLTQDSLGSVRVVTGEDTAAKERRDYLPFGEEVTVGGRGSVPGYTSQAVRQKFTGYEQDSETELGYAGARYFDSKVGRFMSPDDFLNDTKTDDPASWNLYVYVRNNPLKYVDPLGEEIRSVNLDSAQRQKLIND